MLAQMNQDDRKVQLDMFNAQMAQAVMAASDQQSSFDSQMARAVLDASDKQVSFDNQLAKAALDASDKQVSFDNQLAQAVVAAAVKQVSFDNQMAQAIEDAADKQVSFDNQLAQAALDASHKQVSFNNLLALAMESASIEQTGLEVQICNMKGGFDKLTSENVQQLDGLRSHIGTFSALDAATSIDSSDAHIDSKGALHYSFASRRRASMASATSGRISKQFSFSAATDHSKLSNQHGCVTIFFSDLIGFSSWAHKLPPEVVMATLNDLYTRLDDIILEEMPGVYKVRLSMHVA